MVLSYYLLYPSTVGIQYHSILWNNDTWRHMLTITSQFRIISLFTVHDYTSWHWHVINYLHPDISWHPVSWHALTNPDTSSWHILTHPAHPDTPETSWIILTHLNPFWLIILTYYCYTYILMNMTHPDTSWTSRHILTHPDILTHPTHPDILFWRILTYCIIKLVHLN